MDKASDCESEIVSSYPTLGEIIFLKHWAQISIAKNNTEQITGYVNQSLRITTCTKIKKSTENESPRIEKVCTGTSRREGPVHTFSILGDFTTTMSQYRLLSICLKISRARLINKLSRKIAKKLWPLQIIRTVSRMFCTPLKNRKIALNCYLYNCVKHGLNLTVSTSYILHIT